MTEVEDPIVLWCGRFSKSDGYGTVSKNHLRGLDLIGARFAALDLGTLGFVGPGSAALEISGRYTKLIRPKDPDDRVVVVFHERPDHYPRVRVDGQARLIGHSVFETDGLPPRWAEWMVSVDEIWAATDFNRRSFERGGVPGFMIDTLPHSLDTDLYRGDLGEMSLGDDNDVVFLSVCSGLQRRDLGLVFRSFLRAFGPDSPVHYVVKLRDKPESLEAARALLAQAVVTCGGESAAVAEKIELLSVHFGSEEMVRLYRSCDVYVSAERANGWDLPTMESMASGKLTIGYHTGGSTEYTNPDVALRLPVTEVMVPLESAEPHEFYTAQWWPAVDESLMVDAMTAAMDPGLRARVGGAAASHIRKNFDVRVVAERIVQLARSYDDVDYRSHTRATVVIGESSVWRDAGRTGRQDTKALLRTMARKAARTPRRVVRITRRAGTAADAPGAGSVPPPDREPTRRVASELRSTARIAKGFGADVVRRSNRRKLARVSRGLRDVRAATYEPDRVWTDDDLEDRRLAFGRHPLIPVSDSEQAALRSLRNRYLGERCFVMGNGPSLNDTDLSKLADEHTFGVNKIYLLFDRIDWRPSFYTLLDWRVGPEIAPHIDELADSVKFFPNRFRGILRPDESTYWYTTRPVLDHIDDQFRPHIIDGVPSKGTIVVTAIQLAFFLGFRDINLIGVDASYTIPSTVVQSGPDRFGTGVKLNLESTEDDDLNHFDPTYFGKGAKWHDPNVAEMLRQFRQMRKGVEFHGGKIRNATVGGRLEVFERVDFDSLF